MTISGKSDLSNFVLQSPQFVLNLVVKRNVIFGQSVSILLEVLKLLSCVFNDVLYHVIVFLRQLVGVLYLLVKIVIAGHQLAEQDLVLVVSLPQNFALPLRLGLDVADQLAGASLGLLS